MPNRYDGRKRTPAKISRKADRIAVRTPWTDDFIVVRPQTPVGHSLVTIPAEMFERVAELADPQDLLPLRLVCRQIAATIENVFTEAHFTERAFMVTSRPSLSALLDIARSEKYAKFMRKIILYIDVVRPWMKSLWYDKLRDSGKLADLMAVKTEFRNQTSDLGGNHQDLLVASFSFLRRIGNLSELTITYCKANMRHAKGYHLDFMTQGWFATSPERRIHQHNRTISEALRVSQFCPERLELNYRRPVGLRDYREATFLGWSKFPFFQHIENRSCSALRSLCLIGISEADNNSRQSFDKFVQIITASPYLEELTLDTNSDSTFPRFLGNEPDPRNNEDLVLVGRGARKFAETLLERHLPAIKYLSIKQFLLGSHTFLKFLQTNPTLQKVVLDGNCFLHGADILARFNEEVPREYDWPVLQARFHANTNAVIWAQRCRVFPELVPEYFEDLHETDNEDEHTGDI